MKEISIPLSSDIQDATGLKSAKDSDIFKICLGIPLSEEERFQLVECISNTDTAVAYYSSNVEQAQTAQERIFRKIRKLMRIHRNDEGFLTAFKVLRELYRMDAEGVPVDATSLMEASAFYEIESQRSVHGLLQTAEEAGLQVTEAEVRGRSFSFPAKFTDLNTALANVRKDIKHASMLKPDKLRKHLVEGKNGGARLMTHWDVYGALSGRIQSSDYNVQGLPKKIRENCIVPPDGYSLIFSDYSSEELVLIAIMTKDMELLKEIVSGVDLHQKVATEIFSKSITEVTTPERALAKAVVFAFLYGASDKTLESIIAEHWQDGSVTVKAVKKAINKTFAKVRDCIRQIEEQGFICLVNGQQINLEDIPKRHTVFNRMVQGSGAVILKEVIASLAEELPVSAKICFLLHDEVVIEVKNQDTEVCVRIVTKVMTEVLKRYGIDIVMPVSVSVKRGGVVYDVPRNDG